jgi:hypothetical protein
MSSFTSHDKDMGVLFSMQGHKSKWLINLFHCYQVPCVKPGVWFHKTQLHWSCFKQRTCYSMDLPCEGYSVEMLWLLGWSSTRISCRYAHYTSIFAHFGDVHFNQYLDSLTSKAHGNAETRTESTVCQHYGTSLHKGILSHTKGI